MKSRVLNSPGALFARIEQAESAIEEEKTLKLEAIEMCEKIKADLKAYKAKVVQKDEEIRKIKDEYGEMKTQHEEESEAQKVRRYQEESERRWW